MPMRTLAIIQYSSMGVMPVVPCTTSTYPVSTPLSVKMVKEVRGLKAEPPMRVRHRDVMHVTGVMVIKHPLHAFMIHPTKKGA